MPKKWKNGERLLAAIIGGLLIYPLSAQAAAPSKTHGYVFKSQKTKIYSYPRVLHPHSHYLGLSKRYHHHWVFISKQLTVGKQRYVRIVTSSTTPMSTSKALQMVAPVFPARPAKKTAYVRLSSLKPVKVVTSSANTTKQTYWLNRSTDVFLNHPADSQRTVRLLHMTDNYQMRTLYVIKKATLRNDRTYFLVVTKKGHKLGWINAKALTKGQYVDPMKYLTAGVNPSNVITWQSPTNKLNRVVVIKKHQVVSRVLQLWTNDGLTTITDYKNGMPAESSYLTKTKWQSPRVPFKTSTNLSYDQRTKKTSLLASDIMLETSKKASYTAYSLTIAGNGQIQIQHRDPEFFRTAIASSGVQMVKR